MNDDRSAAYGAGAGAIAVALFVVGIVIIGERPRFDAAGAEVAAHLTQHRTRIQIGSAVLGAVAPFLVWFFATVASLTRTVGPGARLAASVAYGCGSIFAALLLVDVAALTVAALRPENMSRAPELAIALRDFEFLLMGNGSFGGVHRACHVRGVDSSVSRALARVARLASRYRRARLRAPRRHPVHHPGAFAPDGLLGLWVPVTAFAGWILIASLVLALDAARAAR